MQDRYVYPAVFTTADDGVSVEFPDLPGCLPCGESLEEAVINAKEALALHLYGMENDGDMIPAPSNVADINYECGEVLMIVEAFMPPLRDKLANKSVNKMVTLPKWLIDLGEQNKVNFSGVLQRALKEQLGVWEYNPIKRGKPVK